MRRAFALAVVFGDRTYVLAVLARGVEQFGLQVHLATANTLPRVQAHRKGGCFAGFQWCQPWVSRCACQGSWAKLAARDGLLAEARGSC